LVVGSKSIHFYQPSLDMPTEVTDAAACRRCGTCCKKGGPAFHRRDRVFIDSGKIQLKHLFTIRQGEPVRDNVRGGLLPAATDIIKIKARPGGRTCAFYDEAAAACRVYTYRPAECRVLNCRDTRDIEAIYEKERLTRRDLLEGVSALWELVDDHQRQCAYEELLPLAGALRREKSESDEEALLYRVRYDLHLRDVVTRKGGIDPDMLDFLFGRPLTVTLNGFGIDFRQTDGRLSITR